MEIFRKDNTFPYAGSVVALGNFDGLHIAHMKIIREGIAYGKQHGLKSGVLLFEEHTLNMTNHRKNVSLITPIEAKTELLEREETDFVYITRFTKEMMKLTPEEFIQQLIDVLNIKAVCVGYDYTFGYKAEGNVALLKKLGKQFGFDVLVTDMVKLDDVIVSSTYIRTLIQNGDMEIAEQFLGRRFCVEGDVIKGLQNGRTIGFPTANVDYDKNMALPLEGVYAGITYVDGRRLKSVINVGKNPTVNGKDTTVESHILNFDEDIYGKYIRVSFAKRLRGEVKFPSLDALKKQIQSDTKQVENMIL